MLWHYLKLLWMPWRFSFRQAGHHESHRGWIVQWVEVSISCSNRSQPISLVLISIIAKTSGKLKWDSNYSNGGFPYNAVSVGWTQQDAIYICRAKLFPKLNMWLPGKLHPKFHACFYAWNGKEYSEKQYEVLTGTGVWVQYKGYLPNNVFKAGEEIGASYLYICRAVVEKILLPGKFKAEHKACYIPYDGKEHKATEADAFEILVGWSDKCWRNLVDQ